MFSDNPSKACIVSLSSEIMASLDNNLALLVGSSASANLSIDDPLLSPLHFTIERTEKGTLLRDADSERGTLVNGRRVKEAWLKDQDQIMAGFTHFIVHLPNVDTPPPPLSPLARYLKHRQPLYALLDAARSPAVLETLERLDIPRVSLFQGRYAQELAAAAPYLVELVEDAPFLETLAEKAWGNSWGVFCVSAMPLEILRRHLRSLLYADTPDGIRFFRFYDPRVLRDFLPVYSLEMAERFFGPVDEFLLEAQNPETLLRFTLGENGVECETIRLGDDGAVGVQSGV
jgi:hypothetical protein